MTELGTRTSAATWHDVECGAYAADLPIWDELATEAGGPVLELGCGTGRVALRLAGAGLDVTAVDVSPTLIAALRERASAAGTELETAVADARELTVARRFALVIAPMQLIQLMPGRSDRERLIRRARGHLAPSGAFAAAILAEHVPAAATAGPAMLPDVLERDGHVFSSLPIEIREVGGAIEVRRLRQTVTPRGELHEEVDITRLQSLSAAELEAEAEPLGLFPRDRIDVPPTADHVGSTIVVLEAGR